MIVFSVDNDLPTQALATNAKSETAPSKAIYAQRVLTDGVSAALRRRGLTHATPALSARPQSGAPVLLCAENSMRAIALDSVIWRAEPIPVGQPIPFSSDTRTRLMLFARNLDLQIDEGISALTAEAEDRNHRLYPLSVEFFGKLPVDQSISFMVVRLSDEMGARTGDVFVRLSYHGLVSNGVQVSIGSPDGSPTPSGNSITLNPATRYQTMNGWEAHAESGEEDFPANFAVYGPTLLDQAVELGINRVRLEVRADVENPGAPRQKVIINDNADPNVYNAAAFNWVNFDLRMNQVIVPLRTRLAAQGETLYINLCYVDFMNTGGSFYHSDNATEYAELILAAFNRMNSTWGFVPNAVEVILEPDTGTNTPRWTAAKVANCLIAAQSRLAAAGYNPRFIVPGNTNCAAADIWYNDIKTVNAATTQYIDELSYHRYVNCDAGQLAANRDAAQADGNRISMLEWWSSSNSYVTLHEDIGPGANGVSWQGSAIAYPDQADNGGQYFNVSSATNVVTIASRTKFYRQYFKYIRRGAVRIEAAGNNSSLNPLAFINANGKYVVVVKATAGQSFNVVGLAAGSYAIKYTTASQYNVDLPDQTISAGATLTTSVPAAGVITVYAK